MDEALYQLRDLVESDYRAVARILTFNDTESPISEQEVRQLFERGVQPRFIQYRRCIVENRTGGVVAVGFLRQDGASFDLDFARAGVSVDPAHQHRGLGRRLFEDLEIAARGRGLKGLWAAVRTLEPRWVRFFESAGFHEQRRQWVSRLDVNEVPVDPNPRVSDRWAEDGVAFTTAQDDGSEMPQVQERVYRLYLDTIKDVPRQGGVAAPSMEEFVGITFGGVGFLPQAMFLARVGDRYVSFTTLHRKVAEPGVLHIAFTGTLVEFRGRGLAGELKRRSIEFARAHGYRYIETDNDSANAKIWSINQKQGFRQFRVWILGEKQLNA
jgi:mycothiol synthase